MQGDEVEHSEQCTVRGVRELSIMMRRRCRWTVLSETDVRSLALSGGRS